MAKNESSAYVEDRWLTKKRLAKYTGLSERSVDLQLRPYLTAYYPCGKNGRKILFDREEVDAYIMSQGSVTNI